MFDDKDARISCLLVAERIDARGDSDGGGCHRRCGGSLIGMGFVPVRNRSVSGKSLLMMLMMKMMKMMPFR